MIAAALAAIAFAGDAQAARLPHEIARAFLAGRRGIRGVRAGVNARRSIVGQADPLALELEALP